MTVATTRKISGKGWKFEIRTRRVMKSCWCLPPPSLPLPVVCRPSASCLGARCETKGIVGMYIVYQSSSYTYDDDDAAAAYKIILTLKAVVLL